MIQQSNCAVHKHRTLGAIDMHHVWPLGLGGPDVEENLIPLCPNGHREVHEYIRHLTKRGGKVPWKLRRYYGRKTRAVAERGYREWQNSLIH